MQKITNDEYKKWTTFIYDLCGIKLDIGKEYLVETRFSSLFTETCTTGYLELLQKIQSSESLKQKAINAITTNETSFFRDNSPFNMLQFKIIPDLIDKRSKMNPSAKQLPIRIWSAACSTGQEVYSTAVTLKEMLGDLSKYDIRILGTDISSDAIAKASHAQYTKFELERGFPPNKLTRFFRSVGEKWQIDDEIRSLATFKTINLLKLFSFPVKFDIIFCRNVAIYFSEEDKRKLFRELCRCLAPDGYLIIGSTESLTGICNDVEPKRYLNSVFYQLKQN